ncbi:hypothetical protein PR048_009299 [Dryococelus australis]|uniref:Uncharacterized protein n=1 Tax=Dryococelus australis TaxID=614101 RepID=A0ABQ9HZG9_9NEOP|nr:hypothetical protein PR048_009299 [Dryococelus australis]
MNRKDSSFESQQVLPSIPLAASVGTGLPGDYDKTVNVNDGMSGLRGMVESVSDETRIEDDHDDIIDESEYEDINSAEDDADFLDVRTHFTNEFSSRSRVKMAQTVTNARLFAVSSEMEKAEDAENADYMGERDNRVWIWYVKDGGLVRGPGTLIIHGLLDLARSREFDSTVRLKTIAVANLTQAPFPEPHSANQRMGTPTSKKPPPCRLSTISHVCFSLLSFEWGKRKITEKILEPATSSGTIPTCENLVVTPSGTEPGSPRGEAMMLTPSMRGQEVWGHTHLRNSCSCIQVNLHWRPINVALTPCTWGPEV